MIDEDQELERALRAAVWKHASTMPMDVRVPELAVALVESMGDRTTEDKLALMAMTYVAAMKMLVDFVPPNPEATS